MICVLYVVILYLINCFLPPIVSRLEPYLNYVKRFYTRSQRLQTSSFQRYYCKAMFLSSELMFHLRWHMKEFMSLIAAMLSKSPRRRFVVA